MTYILGLNAFHGDSAACLLHEGRLVAAAEEERFTRIKHWAGFPAHAIRYCLNEAGIGLDAVAHVALNQDARAHRWRKAGYVLRARPDLTLVLDRFRNKAKRAGIRTLLERSFGRAFGGEVHRIEHHLAHLASAYLVSPFPDAVVASVDGFGDFASAAWGVGEASRIRIDGRVYFPHSLGIFYQAMTQFLGFPHYGDEYKVMGLASYGRPQYRDALSRLVRLEDHGAFRLELEYFRHHREKVAYEWEEGSPRVGTLYSDALAALLGPARREDEKIEARHADLAASAQAVYEEALFHLLHVLHRRYGIDALALSGGCAMNSVANGRIHERTPFTKLYVQAAAGDAGGAIGAALIASQRASRGGATARDPVRYPMDHAYWGPQFAHADIMRLLESRADDLARARCTIAHAESEEALCAASAQAVASGKVVGWFQGRMEWGPRALGNRSIVGDPRRADMKDVLNHKIKRRESFRPFAPSILREAVAEWFEHDADVPFMMQVHPVRSEKRALIPAVTHVDGTGRLQTVTRESNPRYYRLIQAFAALTGIPIVLNTSFNENEPVVCTPTEALACFLRTRMDVLVLGNVVIARTD